MKHLDFTRVVIIPADDSSISVARIDPWFIGDVPCECCGRPAEYVLESSWDPMRQCSVYECQSCLVSSMAAPDSPDTYQIISS